MVQSTILFLAFAMYGSMAEPAPQPAAPPAKEQAAAKPQAPAAVSPLAQVSKVYLLPMRNGLDQYLASHLTSQKVVTIVADPKKADAILTDRLGEGFESKIAELLAPPKSEDAKKAEGTARAGRFVGGSGSGTVFLVDPKSMSVLWSVYQPPRNTSRQEMDAVAKKITSELGESKHGPRKKKLGIL